MEILIIIVIILWIYSSYLYHISKFKGAYTPPTFEDSVEEQELIDHIHKLYGKPNKPVFSPDYDQTPDFTINLKPSDQFMSAEDKYNYLLSPKWQDLRTQVFIRDNYTCQSCNSTKLLECHHINYINLGTESLKDLITLCRPCHQNIHNQLGYDRTTIFNINTSKI